MKEKNSNSPKVRKDESTLTEIRDHFRIARGAYLEGVNHASSSIPLPMRQIAEEAAESALWSFLTTIHEWEDCLKVQEEDGHFLSELRPCSNITRVLNDLDDVIRRWVEDRVALDYDDLQFAVDVVKTMLHEAGLLVTEPDLAP